jgi:hypothetical protein
MACSAATTASSAAVLACAQCDLRMVGEVAGTCATCAADNDGNGRLCAACVGLHSTLKLFKAHEFEEVPMRGEYSPCKLRVGSEALKATEFVCFLSHLTASAQELTRVSGHIDATAASKSS